MQTFEELYTQYAPDVHRFAFWLCGNPMDAEDITSETFVRAWLRFRSIRMETLRGYLLKIARNLYLAKKRKGRKLVELREHQPDPSPGVEAQVQVRIAIGDAGAFLQTLPECDRTAFILRVEYELSYAEVARVLDISEVAARVKTHRVRKRLLLTSIDGSAGRDRVSTTPSSAGRP